MFIDGTAGEALVSESSGHFAGSGRNPTNTLVAIESNGSFTNNSIANSAPSATLRN